MPVCLTNLLSDSTGDPQDGHCGRSDAISVIYADSGYGRDTSLILTSVFTDIGQDNGIFLLKGIIFKGSEKVTDLFLSLHSEWHKPAPAPAESSGEPESVRQLLGCRLCGKGQSRPRGTLGLLLSLLP